MQMCSLCVICLFALSFQRVDLLSTFVRGSNKLPGFYSFGYTTNEKFQTPSEFDFHSTGRMDLLGASVICNNQFLGVTHCAM